MNAMTTPPRKGELEVQRFLVPYRVYGVAGPQLVMLNGVQQSMAMWSSFVRRFSHTHRIILVDLPAQGKAETLWGSAQVSLDEQVAVLYEVVNACGATEITLCSASWGGVVALAFASKYPQLVRKMILGSLGTRPNEKMIETIEAGGRANPEDRPRMANILIESFGQSLPKAMKNRIKQQFCTMTQENLDAFHEHGRQVIAAKNLGEFIDLTKIQTETILINGASDTIIDLDDVHYLSRQMPNCTTRIVERVGHFLHLESEHILDIYSEALPKA